VYAATIAALWSGVSNGSAALVVSMTSFLFLGPINIRVRCKIVQAGAFAEASRQLVRVLAQVELDFNSVGELRFFSTTQ
jgi:hypothetical protein